MIIDVHTHVWPDKIAAAALQGKVEDLERFGDGRVASLIASMDRAGVDRSVCLAVAESARTVDRANEFAAALDPNRLIGFGTTHPELSVEENLASLRRHGLRGIKVHPLFQRFGLDDPRLLALLDAMRGEFVVIAHVGAGGDDSTNALCTPPMLRDLVRQLPGLDLVACHFGGYRMIEEARELVIGLPVYLDTSWPPTLGALQAELLRATIEQHGPERVLFASDWPMADVVAEIEVIRSLGLSDDDTAAVLGGNAARLLGIPG